MIIFLYGPDSYRRREKLNEYLDRYQNKYAALSLSLFYLAEENEFQKLKDFVQSQSLFESSKLGVIYNLGDLEAKNQKEFVGILKDNLKTKDLTLIVDSDKKPTKEFLRQAQGKQAIIWEFENLTGAEPEKFLEKEATKRKIILDKESQNLLMQVYSGDSWGLVTELDKLSLLDEKKITRAVLENHLNVVLPINVFSFANQLRNSENAGQRLTILEKLLENGDPAMIFNIMAVSPYSDLAWKQKAADYDAAVKSGKLDYEEILLDLII